MVGKTMQIPLYSSIELGYLTGAIDIQGIIGIEKLEKKGTGRKFYRCRLRINTKRKKILSYLKKTFRISRKITRGTYSRKGFEINMNSHKEIKRILLLVRSYLIENKKQAEFMLGYIRYRESLPPITKGSSWRKIKGKTNYSWTDVFFFQILLTLNATR